MWGGWKYEERPLNGGAGGEAFRIVFNGSGIEPAATLAREAIQNSVDAALEVGAEVEVDIVLRELLEAERQAFMEAARLDQIAERSTLLALPSENALDHPERPLRLLYVSDRRTTGLSGDPTDSSSKLRKLLMEMGGSGKMEEAHSGGSYGFGKAVYGGSSRIATIFAYSRTTDHEGRPLSVFMGCAYHRGHTFKGEETTGRAFFGEAVTVEGKGVRFDPYTGEKADRLADALGMPRDADDVGTTVLIVDTPIEMSHIRRGVEDYWWPRLELELLDVHLVDTDGTIPQVRPKIRDDLKPFIDAFSCAQNKSPSITGKYHRKEFSRLGDLSVGEIGLAVVPETEENTDVDAPESERLDTIALIRSPLMVVQYYGKRSIGVPPVAGAFLADNDIDDILRRSEPPEHDRWSPTALRLETSKGEHDVVKSVLSRVWRELKAFQRIARPAETKRPKRLMRLERILADWFGASAKRTPIPDPSDPAPVSIRPTVHVEDIGGRLQLSGSVSIGLKPGSDLEELPLRIDLSCLVREEDGVSSTDPVPLTVTHGPEVTPREEHWVGVVSPQKDVVLKFESDTYDPTWTVRLVPEVKPLAEEQAA